MPSLTCFQRRFTLSWQKLLLALLAMGILSGLGQWQLKRAEQKKQMLVAAAQASADKDRAWRSHMALPKQYQSIRVQGVYLDTLILLDNQHYQHQFGYDVITPLLLDNDKIILVDRGWVPGSRTRAELPVVDTPVQKVTVKGYAYFPSDKNWVLGQVIEEKSENTFVVEQMDTLLMSKFLHKSVYPFIIRLNKDEANGYIRDWPIVAMPPERHYAYAMQWFAMALVVLVIFIGLSFKKADEENKS
ncbi:SURF1 family protein [Legionella dresdenensis]|uniref:SURF1-like protein n=1 Tax=Legionella dresdenensis TaxID=450200 RepID=A0ABV8CG82_9GAMM